MAPDVSEYDMTTRRVEFRTIDGVILRGDYFAVAQDNAPIIVMTQGLTLLKEFYIDDIARRFQQHGLACLVYDHRGWGSSEGNPRQQTDLLQQAEDYHDAVSFVRSLAPAIDPQRVCIWGIGHSGGASMIAAGDDPRVKCTVLYMPMPSGSLDAKGMPPGSVEEALKERQEHTTQPNHQRIYVPVFDSSLEQAQLPHDQAVDANGHRVWLHGDVPYKFASGGAERAQKVGTPWEGRITLQSLYLIAGAEPENHIYKIAPRKLLYIAAKIDPLTGPLENHKRVFQKAKNDNATFVVVGDDHISNYFKGWEEATKVQVEWLEKNL